MKKSFPCVSVTLPVEQLTPLTPSAVLKCTASPVELLHSLTPGGDFGPLLSPEPLG